MFILKISGYKNKSVSDLVKQIKLISIKGQKKLYRNYKEKYTKYSNQENYLIHLKVNRNKVVINIQNTNKAA